MTFEHWLALREPADAAARARDLVDRLPPHDRWLIHDLGAGTGAMGRWLAPRLQGPQHWVLHDTDADLLDIADIPGVTVETERSDVTRAQFAGATLITASALLDLLTGDELGRLVAAVAGARCPALLTLSVTGRIALTPAEALDQRVAEAFNAHQRRGRRLGPDAVAAAVEALGDCVVRSSPWRLDAVHADLIAEWLDGWVGAACEQEPALAAEAGAYRERRLAQDLAVTVDHADVLVLP
jgi:hypothetical protein